MPPITEDSIYIGCIKYSPEELKPFIAKYQAKGYKLRGDIIPIPGPKRTRYLQLMDKE